jgi:CelD/BcsL family acetyltransferase involved in cellulose biosynthesis
MVFDRKLRGGPIKRDNNAHQRETSACISRRVTKASIEPWQAAPRHAPANPSRAAYSVAPRGLVVKMLVELCTSLEQLEPYAPAWNCIARHVPFRRWEWLSAWWRQYGQGRPLFVLAVFHGESLVGLAPWFIDACGARGRMLRFLGVGEVCSDYLSVLATAEHEEAVATALANWLSQSADATDVEGQPAPAWDLLELEAVCASDRMTACLAEQLVEHDFAIHRRRTVNCWRIELPATWEEYLDSLGKTHRRQMRQIDQQSLRSGRAVMRFAASPEEFERGWEILVDLHQRRRQSLGQPGCFASPQFAAFLREAADGLFREGALDLGWVEIDGKPVAAEFDPLGDRVTYSYQSGIDPDALDQKPGHIAHLAILRRAIESGQRAFDFLRGDEVYKARLRGEPRPLLDLRLAPPRVGSRIRHGVWLAGDAMKSWLKSGLQLTGMK